MLVFVLQRILSLLGQNILLLCHYIKRKRIMNNRIRHIVFLCHVRFLHLLSVCLQRASVMHMLRLFFSVFGEFQAPPIALEYELQPLELFTIDPFRQCQGRRGKKDRFGTCGQGLSVSMSENKLPTASLRICGFELRFQNRTSSLTCIIPSHGILMERLLLGLLLSSALSAESAHVCTDYKQTSAADNGSTLKLKKKKKKYGGHR